MGVKTEVTNQSDTDMNAGKGSEDSNPTASSSSTATANGNGNPGLRENNSEGGPVVSDTSITFETESEQQQNSPPNQSQIPAGGGTMNPPAGTIPEDQVPPGRITDDLPPSGSFPEAQTPPGNSSPSQTLVPRTIPYDNSAPSADSPSDIRP